MKHSAPDEVVHNNTTWILRDGGFATRFALTGRYLSHTLSLSLSLSTYLSLSLSPHGSDGCLVVLYTLIIEWLISLVYPGCILSMDIALSMISYTWGICHVKSAELN